MKVLWLCNIVIPKVCEVIGMPKREGGGWLDQLSTMLDEEPEVDLVVCAPFKNTNSWTYAEWGKKSKFYGFTKKEWDPSKYDSSVEVIFDEILDREQPDIVHIFGTEYPHTLAMVRAFGNSERTVIHIQGLVSEISKHYCSFLPQYVTRAFSFRDFVRQDNIVQQQKKFAIRGKYEIEALQNVGHVMGRTDWDRACVYQINPRVEYHFVQEMMREAFYTGRWDYDSCEKHSIFMSQGGYPIKGLHLMLEALAMIKKDYPDTKLYVAGDDISDCCIFSKKIRQPYYSKYICRLLEKYGLKENVIFTGRLNAEQMKERYLKCNVFVSASSIESSPNSIGEALLLGVPIVSSDVGGVSSLMQHKANGYLYPADDSNMLAYYVKEIFQTKGELLNSHCTVENVREVYNFVSILSQLMNTYSIIIEEAKEYS